MWLAIKEDRHKTRKSCFWLLLLFFLVGFYLLFIFLSTIRKVAPSLLRQCFIPFCEFFCPRTSIRFASFQITPAQLLQIQFGLKYVNCCCFSLALLRFVWAFNTFYIRFNSKGVRPSAPAPGGKNESEKCRISGAHCALRLGVLFWFQIHHFSAHPGARHGKQEALIVFAHYAMQRTTFRSTLSTNNIIGSNREQKREGKSVTIGFVLAFTVHAACAMLVI